MTGCSLGPWPRDGDELARARVAAARVRWAHVTARLGDRRRAGPLLVQDVGAALTPSLRPKAIVCRISSRRSYGSARQPSFISGGAISPASAVTALWFARTPFQRRTPQVRGPGASVWTQLRRAGAEDLPCGRPSRGSIRHRIL